ncbi:hypothetical protein C1646_662293 [Rhizophagus diaphanus]|nr:hypothetical protein C1646_662293 [Rhizophagus diaphanus] [Rhizophagus sp. MUCL 43196]
MVSSSIQFYGNDLRSSVLFWTSSRSTLARDTKSIGKKNIENTKDKVRATVQACEKGQITCGGYQNSASICQGFTTEWLVSSERMKIAWEINEIIPISLINMSPLSDNSVNLEVHIDDADITNNVQQSIDKGLNEKEVLYVTRPKIHLSIFDDRRNVGKK